MATLTVSQLTLAEQIKQHGPNGQLMEIVNTLAEENEMDIDAIYQQANDGFSHLGVKTLALPTVGHRRINAGASGGVGRTKQVREAIEILEARPAIDKLLLRNEPNPDKVRMNQILMFVESMAQAKADALLYGDNEDDADEIDGLLTRYNSTSDSNVYGMGGTGSDVASVVIVQWDEKRCHLVYPKALPNGGEVFGISNEDRGLQALEDDDGKRYDAFESVINVGFGINIMDDRCVQRLANIESSGTSNTMFADNKINSLILAINKLPKKGKGAVIYCNPDIKAQFDIYALNHLLGCTVVEDTTGAPVTMFQNRIPIRSMEALLSTEAAIS